MARAYNALCLPAGLLPLTAQNAAGGTEDGLMPRAGENAGWLLCKRTESVPGGVLSILYAQSRLILTTLTGQVSYSQKQRNESQRG